MNPFDDTESLPPIAENQLPADSGWLFPEYTFEKMSLGEYDGVIIERILEKGSWAQLRWLFATYGKEDVASWVRNHGFRLLSKRSFSLWKSVLDIHDYFAPDWAVEAKAMDIW